jgi:hypothetical protein
LLKKKDTWCVNVEGDLFYDVVLRFPQEQKARNFTLLPVQKMEEDTTRLPIAPLPAHLLVFINLMLVLVATY